MKSLIWVFIIGCALMLAGTFALAATWIWTGDGRWGWLALLSLLWSLLSALFAGGFTGIDRADEDKNHRVGP